MLGKIDRLPTYDLRIFNPYDMDESTTDNMINLAASLKRPIYANLSDTTYICVSVCWLLHHDKYFIHISSLVVLCITRVAHVSCTIINIYG